MKLVLAGNVLKEENKDVLCFNHTRMFSFWYIYKCLWERGDGFNFYVNFLEKTKR